MADNIPILSDITYRIEHELGSGGGGVVYKAWHQRLQMHVVIKELRSGTQHDIETQRNEVEALKNVKSPYLPQVYDFLSENNRIFTVMEYIEGESLDKVLAKQIKFSQQDVVKWLLQLSTALEALHEKGVCHRDIKPANIMLMPNGDVCLIDFNAALVSGNDIRMISRSLGYTSPEQYDIYEQYKNGNIPHINQNNPTYNPPINDDDSTELLSDDLTERFTHSAQDNCSKPLTSSGNIDWFRSDIYSLGATIYHMLSGVRPPNKAVETVPISKVGRFSQGIIFVLEQCMKQNPSERFSSVSVLLTAVKNIHEHDKRWRILQLNRMLCATIIPAVFVLSLFLTIAGRNLMNTETTTEFYTYIYNIENDIEAKTSFEQATQLSPYSPEPYSAMAKRLYDGGDIEGCRELILQFLNTTVVEDLPEYNDEMGDIHYILANCYYYDPISPNYSSAVNSFRIAIEYVNDNPAFYRDCAIAYAKVGDLDSANSLMQQAQSLGLDEDSTFLLKGEIASAQQDYDTALLNYNSLLNITTDSYLIYRAVHSMDSIYRQQQQYQMSIDLLESRMNDLPINQVNEMRERLADAYYSVENYDKAIELFSLILEDGFTHFHIMQNLVVIYQRIDNFDSAETILADMEELFPGDYRVYMQMAFLTADKQSLLPNEQRDYSLFEQYYNNTISLYEQNTNETGLNSEMQQLETIMQQLTEHGWL